jgi:hypothetical protein
MFAQVTSDIIFVTDNLADVDLDSLALLADSHALTILDMTK